jgi:hypothetical protein
MVMDVVLARATDQRRRVRGLPLADPLNQSARTFNEERF